MAWTVAWTTQRNYPCEIGAPGWAVELWFVQSATTRTCDLPPPPAHLARQCCCSYTEPAAEEKEKSSGLFSFHKQNDDHECPCLT